MTRAGSWQTRGVTRAGVVTVVVGAVAAFGDGGCGGRGDLISFGDEDAARSGAMTGAGGRHGTRSVDAAAGFEAGGAAEVLPDRDARILDATTAEASLKDASAADATSFDAQMDAPPETRADVVPQSQCAVCPPDDYFVDATFDGVPLHFTAANPLSLYCVETTVEMEHPACSEVFSLTACGSERGKAPCLYLSLNRVTGPLIGFFMDSTGQTWDMETVTMSLDPFSGRTSTGTFEATFSSHGDAGILRASGTFRACLALSTFCEG